MAAGVGLLVVRPHPDDESSATGGILARCAARGIPTAVVTCTRGEEGEILAPDVNRAEARPHLGDLREGELRRACATLGVVAVRLLGYRDSGMPGAPSCQHPAALCNADLDEAAGRLVGVLRELRPHVVITENADGTYGHPDHVMTHRLTLRAFAAAADPARYADAGPPWRPARLYAVVGVGRHRRVSVAGGHRPGLARVPPPGLHSCAPAGAYGSRRRRPLPGDPARGPGLPSHADPVR